MSCVGGAVGVVLSVGYGNLILLACSCPVNMVFNLILSVYILKETFTKWDAIAISVISAGSISCMILSKQSNFKPTDKIISEMFLSLSSLVIYVVFGTYLISTYFF